MKLPLLLLLLLFSATTFAAPSLSPTPSPTTSPIPRTSPTPHTSSSSPLDPKQLKALESLNIPTVKNPCDHPPTSSKPHATTVTCDTSSPFRLVTSLSFTNCSSSLSISSTALKALSPSLTSLSFHNCPSLPPPPHLPASLHSFSAVSSFPHLSGLSLARLVNLTDLTVTSVPVSTSGLFVILGNMRDIISLTISHANLSGKIPKTFHSNLTFIDLSNNLIKGSIPTSITLLPSLKGLNLSSNSISGDIPDTIGDLVSLKNLSLSSNKLSGPIPDSISSIPELTHLDLSRNQLNGTVPRFISKMKSLKFLNLANNAFHGVLPFDASFIKKLEVFRVGGNSDLCYNHTVLSSKMKLGIAMCDKHGLPLSPPPQKEDSSSDYDYSEDDSSEKGDKEEEHHGGPNKVVLGVAIGLSSLVFLIIFLILLAKWCG